MRLPAVKITKPVKWSGDTVLPFDPRRERRPRHPVGRLLAAALEERVRGQVRTYFKATLQGDTELKGSVTVSENSGYDGFLAKSANSTVAGYFFTTAFQEFDIKSQRARIADLPRLGDLEMCLSGPFEMIYSLIAIRSCFSARTNTLADPVRIGA